MVFKKIAFVAALAAPFAPRAAAQVTGNDILVFALQLECLEAEFYSCVVDGVGLSEELRGGGPSSIGCQQAQLSALSKDLPYGSLGLAKELKEDEVNHVRFLRAALGDAATPCPHMNISPRLFNAAAQAAFGLDTKPRPQFNPYANDLFFLHGAFIFEDVGVTAYNGAVPAATILLPPEIVQYAASILGTEAYHAGAIRDRLLIANAETAPVAAYNSSVAEIVQAISDLRDSVDWASDLDQGIVMDGMENITPVDANGLVFARSVAQVLNIVYLGGKTKGGFFPDGINGLFGEVSRKDLLAAQKALNKQVNAATLCNAPPPPGPGAEHKKMKKEDKKNKKEHKKEHKKEEKKGEHHD